MKQMGSIAYPSSLRIDGVTSSDADPFSTDRIAGKRNDHVETDCSFRRRILLGDEQGNDLAYGRDGAIHLNGNGRRIATFQSGDAYGTGHHTL
jgi:hypothetical protein